MFQLDDGSATKLAVRVVQCVVSETFRSSVDCLKLL